jgi:hypothetical protein
MSFNLSCRDWSTQVVLETSEQEGWKAAHRHKELAGGCPHVIALRQVMSVNYMRLNEPMIAEPLKATILVPV